MSITISSSRSSVLLQYVDRINITNETSRDNGKSSANKTELEINLKRHKNINIRDLVREGDILSISKNNILSTGKVKKVKETYKNLDHDYSVVIYDQLMEGIETEFSEDIVWTNMYLCNNNEPSSSIAHRLANLMGFSDEDINFDNALEKVNYIHLKEGEKILSQFTELAQAVLGKVFVDHRGVIHFKNGLFDNDYNDTNITLANLKKEISVDTIESNNDGVKVNYDKFLIQDKDVVWKFINDQDSYDEKEDIAYSTLPPETNSAKLSFDYVSDVCLGVKLSTILVRYPEDGEWKIVEPIEIDSEDTILADGHFYYEVELNKTGGKVQFFNRLDKEVYINRFHIEGKPLVRVEGNYVLYAQSSDHYNLNNINNKYIQSEELAKQHANRRYDVDCFDRDKYSINININDVIKLKDKVNIGSLDVNTDAVIERIRHTIEHPKNRTEVDLEAPVVSRSINYTDIVENASDVDWQNPYALPNQIENLELFETSSQKKDGTYLPQIRATWENKGNEINDIYVRKIGVDRGWRFVATVSGEEFVYTQVEAGYTYQIKVVATSYNSAIFSKAPYKTITIAGKTENDVIVEWAQINWRADYISLNWYPVDDENNDIVGYEVRTDKNFGNTIE